MVLKTRYRLCDALELVLMTPQSVHTAVQNLPKAVHSSLVFPLQGSIRNLQFLWNTFAAHLSMLSGSQTAAVFVAISAVDTRQILLLTQGHRQLPSQSHRPHTSKEEDQMCSSHRA